jgi:hypothetical protein
MHSDIIFSKKLYNTTDNMNRVTGSNRDLLRQLDTVIFEKGVAHSNF